MARTLTLSICEARVQMGNLSGMNRRSWRRKVLLCSAISILSIRGPARGEEISVTPGGLVRWSGEGIEKCALGDRSWEPLAGDCWFPIDLLTEKGPLEVIRWRAGERETKVIQVAAYPYEVQRITLEDDSQVNLSAADLERVRGENQRIAQLWSLESPRQFKLPLASPLDPLPPGGRFGSRRFFNDQPRSPHSGVDFSADFGTPVLAAATGVVALTGDFFFSGRSVFLDHGDGLISMYFHLSGIAVAAGETVNRGEVVGLVGATGRATGPHLHFGIRWHRARIDPQLLMASRDRILAVPSL